MYSRVYSTKISMAANVSGYLSIVDGNWVFCPMAGQEMTAKTISEMHSKGISVASPEKPLEPGSGGTLELSLVEGPMNSGHASTMGTTEMEGVVPADFSGEPVCDEMKHEVGNPFTLADALATASPDRSKGLFTFTAPSPWE